MGRGRAKAKQTRVARKLKYQSPDVNLDRLRADLCADPPDQADDQHSEDSQDAERAVVAE